MPQRKFTKQSIWDVEALRTHMSEYQVKPVHLRSLWKLSFVAESLQEVCEKLSECKCPPPLRWTQALQNDFVLSTSTPIEFQTKNAAAGCKLVVQTQDGLILETVVMKAGDTVDSEKTGGRVTLCVSSQVGCKMGCTFCETGTLGHLGNLTAGEIVEQVYHAQRWVRAGSLGDTKIRNIVFMGMGEPLDNLYAVRGAIEAMMCDLSFGIVGRHITVSTVGVVGKIAQLAEDPLLRQVNLAVSLHAATQSTRLRIVPSAKGFPMDKFVQAMFDYCEKTGRGIMIEYIVLAGLNDSEDDARELAVLLGGLNCWLNLIPYNPTSVGETNGFVQPTNESLMEFEQHIRRRNCRNHIGDPLSIRTRYSTQSGQDVDSACGQLAAAATLKRLASSDDKLRDLEDLVPKHNHSAVQRHKKRKTLEKHLFNHSRYEFFACAGVMVTLAFLYRWHKVVK